MLTSNFKLALMPVLAALLLGGTALHAQDDAAVAFERMRDALRTTTMQLRTTQNELATALVQNETLAAENERLQAALTQLQKQSAAYKAASETNIGNLNTQLTDRSAEAARLAALLKQWQDAYGKAAQIARGKEEERAELAANLGVMERDMALLRTQNMELYRLGSEILDRYEDFGLGRAIAAREPFTGLARVRLQTLVQDYRDNLAAGRERLSGKGEAGDPASVTQ